MIWSVEYLTQDIVCLSWILHHPSHWTGKSIRALVILWNLRLFNCHRPLEWKLRESKCVIWVSWLIELIYVLDLHMIKFQTSLVVEWQHLWNISSLKFLAVTKGLIMNFLLPALRYRTSSKDLRKWWKTLTYLKRKTMILLWAVSSLTSVGFALLNSISHL
jgi:hypothetical protein